ncbi:MAG TPA: SDR family NAD(P)-dependent oxidoreductase, partial [Ktedonobacterales bacterium]|nr:SDR family NAD(P)-dependent oxidoreductase [Ktedonobacterales bacterium]
MRFKDKVALITAVGSGIGRASADIMAAEGAVIIGVDNDERRLAMAMEAINMSGGRAIGRPTNALNEGEVNDVVAWAGQQYGTVDILVNAVGGSTIIEAPGATVDQLNFDEWQRLIAFNLNGTFLFCHAVTPLMKRRKYGKIVNLASIAGRGLSVSSSSAYSAAKGGIIAFTRKLA